MIEQLSSEELRCEECERLVIIERGLMDPSRVICTDCEAKHADDSLEDCGMDDDYELDEFEEAMYDCHGHFDEPGPGGLFQCGAVGSEDCDECPMHKWLGLTNRQIDRLEETE